MELPTDFTAFLRDIRPTDAQQKSMQVGHTDLRERLKTDEEFKPLLVSDFLQGSYRRATAVRPKGDTRSDVDIIIVTKIAEDVPPAKAMDAFKPFLEKHYKGKWRAQGRSFGIELPHVDMDLVITAAPSEAQIGILESEAVENDDDIEAVPDWKLHLAWIAPSKRTTNDRVLLEKLARDEEWRPEPLRIPDRTVNEWQDTHPLEQIKRTRELNRSTHGNFVNVVKALKWWWLKTCDGKATHPKGYPLERIVGECCPDGIRTVAEGVAGTLQSIVTRFAAGKPKLPDYGVQRHDVLASVTTDQFAVFYQRAKVAAALAKEALDVPKDRDKSARLWHELFGDPFPCPPGDGGGGQKGGFKGGGGPASPGPERFA